MQPAMKRIWDVPVRLMHAAFITGVAGAWLARSAELIDWHAVFGYTALAALCMRIVWGFAGPAHSRFRSFAYRGDEVASYLRQALRGSPRHYAGHNPAGSWSVFVLLALIGATCVSGVASSGALHAMGPLAGVVSFAAGDASLRLHDALAWIVLAVVAVHLAGVAWGSRLHRENLVRAMVTGRKRSHGDAAAEAPSRAALGAAMLLIVITTATAYVAWNVPREVTMRADFERDAKRKLSSQAWFRECSDCHLAYSPALLPARSWERMLREQDRHFGEDLSLPQAKIERLRQAIATAPPSWAAWKLARSAAPGDEPQKITELPYWREAHRRIPAARYSAPTSAGRHDCEACHRDALSGIFHPRMIRRSKPGNDS
jgi:cytochrome b